MTVTRIYGDEFATVTQLEDMTDRDVIELAREDMIEFFDGAQWVIERQQED